MIYHTIYEGEELQYTMRFAEPNKIYSFRVCQYHSGGSVGVCGPWSMTKRGYTTLSPHSKFFVNVVHSGYSTRYVMLFIKVDVQNCFFTNIFTLRMWPGCTVSFLCVSECKTIWHKIGSVMWKIKLLLPNSCFHCTFLKSVDHSESSVLVY